jgi:hypothetical protein
MMQFTIESDEEVPIESLSDDDDEIFNGGGRGGSKSAKKGMKFRFDDGMVRIGFTLLHPHQCYVCFIIIIIVLMPMHYLASR